MTILALMMAACTLRAEIIDRVAVTIDSQVIAASRIDEETRVTAFQNGEPPDFSPATRRRTADRLVEQALIQREMQLTRFPEPQPADIQDTLKLVRARYPGASYAEALARYGITEQQLEQALLRQAATLRYIDLRFRPEVQVQDAEVLRYYEEVFVPECRRKKVDPVPSFDDARSECEEALIAERVDKRVEAWLKEMRGRTRIRYEEDAFE